MKVKIDELRDSSTKRMIARFYTENGRLTRTIKFGFRGGSTYPDHKDETTMRNYLKRHRVNEDWSTPYSAGSLSRWVLWSAKSLSGGKKNYARRYNLKLINKG